MKKILIIHTGGTFGMAPLKPTPTLAPNQVEANITTFVPELEQIAHIDFVMAFNLDSADIHPEHWKKLAGIVHNNIDNYDGFVIIHGTDSMVYTAAALSFMLKNLPKPVILTGSQRPLAEIRTDARMNLINAVELATRNIPEVCIFFEQELLRGNRAIKISTTDYGAFISPNYPPLAEVGLEIKIGNFHLQPSGNFELFDKISEAVLSIPFFPGFQPAYLQWLMNAPVKAVIIEALGMGNVAVKTNSMVPLIKKLSDCGKIVVVTSRSRHGRIDLSRYQNGMLIKKAGAIGVNDMTTETTIVKLMHLLGCFPDELDKVRKMIYQPIAGEVALNGGG